MAFHKKKARRAIQRRLAAIEVSLKKLRALKKDMQQMMLSTHTTTRLPASAPSVEGARSEPERLVEVPVSDADRNLWAQQLAALEEKERLLVAEQEGLTAPFSPASQPYLAALAEAPPTGQPPPRRVRKPRPPRGPSR